MKRKDIIFIIYLLILLTTILSSVLIVIKDQDSAFELIAILPIIFSLTLLINYNWFSKIISKSSVILLLSCYYIRMVIIPVIFAYSNYSSLVVNEDYLLYVSNAIFLAAYEFFIVISFLNIFIKNKENINYINKDEIALRSMNNNNNDNNKQNKKNTNKFVFYIVALTLIIVLIAIMKYPHFKYYFRFIFETDTNKVNMHYINYVHMRDMIPSVVYWLVLFFIDILQVMIPIILINSIKNYHISNSKKVFLSLIVILFSLLICTPETARSVIISLALFLILIKIYPKQKKFLLLIVACLLVPAIFYGLFLKSGSDYSISEISKTLNAYFSGISNISVSFSIQNRPNIRLLFNDFLHSLPFVRAFFKNMTTSGVLFNNAFYSKSGIHNQIMPMISQSLCYFGFILSPILSYLSVRMSFYFEDKYNRVNDIYIKYIELLCVIFFAAAPILYNFTILVSTYLGVLVPCMFITKFGYKKKNCETG